MSVIETIKRDVAVLFEGEKYPTLCSISRLVTTLNGVLEMQGPPSSWNLGMHGINDACALC